jgi:hypothetical protein
MSDTASSTAMQQQPRFVLGEDRLSVADTTFKSIHGDGANLLLCRTTNSQDAEFILNKLNSHEQLVAALRSVVEYYDYAEFGPIAQARAALAAAEA